MNTETPPIHLLAVGAHPDDLEFGMGGILLREFDAGATWHLVVTSKGEAGTSGTPEKREAEARAAAAQVGAAERLRFLDFGGDGRQTATPDHAIALARVIREVKPAMVFAPLPFPNQHPDHAAVGAAARDACRLARYGGLAPLKELPRHAVQSLWFYALGDVPDAQRTGEVLVDVSDVIERWKALMACHQTQVSSRRYIDYQLARARHLGLRAGCDHAIPLWPNEPPVVQHIHTLARTARGF
jgi:LmbE family N-acetylglucosaminyl deacetylase